MLEEALAGRMEILHDLGGHKLTDIAKIKGVSVAAAQSRLVVAAKSLNAFVG